MFMNDMPLNVSASVDMYADDSTITATGKTTEAVEEKLNNDLHDVSKWCEENKMVINAEKTKHQARQTFYHSFILPHMDYCSTLWGDASAAERIHKLQKRAARVITDSPYRTPSAPLFELLRWLLLPDRVKYRKALLVFKSVKGLAPDYMCELFESVQMVSSRNTRSNARDDLYVPRARTQLFQSTLTISGANIWNKLSTAIRSCNSVADFKCAYMREICH